MLAFLRRVVDVRDDELAALLWSFLFSFALMAGWFVLRPIRDETGVAGGTRNLPWLFTATFLSMLALVPLYAAVVARVPRRRLVPIVYQFFALNLVVFYLLLRFGVAPVWTARVFFIWASVFNLFVVSMLWSVMADSWRSEQGQRLFGLIAAGGSAGAIVGPTITTALVGVLGPARLLLVAVAFLELSVVCVVQLGRHAARTGGDDAASERASIGGGILTGLKNTVTSPYLLAIAGTILLYTITNTFIYNQQAKLFEALIADPKVRTRIFGAQDMTINIIAVVMQAGVTGRIVAAVGMSVALAALPIFTAAGFGAMVIWPSVAVVIVVHVARRSLHFAVDRPLREVLYTVVSREDRYKSKSFIDTVVYRGGDALAGWLFTALAGMATVAAIPMSLLWLVVALGLARRYRARQVQGATP